MPQQIDPELKRVLLSTTFRPAVTMWNRLEGRPRKQEFERSLRVEVRDPLWMLTRQWQFGEFKGEDSGSAAKARVQVSTGRVNQFAVKSENRDATGGEQWQPAVPYDIDLPLEVQVEREPVWETVGRATDYLALRSQMGRHWNHLLQAAGVSNLRPAFVLEFGFEDVSQIPNPTEAQQVEAAQVQSDPAAWQFLQALIGRLPDGRRLLTAIESGAFDAWVDEQIDSSVRTPLKNLGRDFKTWFYRLYSQPATGFEDAWAPSYLEYQFAIAAPDDESGEASTMLVADQYHQGRLDWYAFDIDSEHRLEEAPNTSAPGGDIEVLPVRAFVPTQIEFNGMPNVRWWQIEDRRTDFGSIHAGTTDVPLLLLAEFCLIYGNDWSVIPYNLPVGTSAEIDGLVVTDVFGVRTLIRAAGEGQRMDWQRWAMYSLAPRAGIGPPDRRLFLAPSIAKSQEGDAFEKVLLARDEMTNMVWGVEDRIPGVLGNGVDGFESASSLSKFFLHRSSPAESVPAAGTNIRYVLGSTVPENWIPFIARHKPGSQREIRLQRASMARITDAIPQSRVEPRGRILRTGLDATPVRQAYFLHEEEVPRAGVVVTRSFQRARWFDGRVFTWIGRRKQTGRGQAASGLAFDQVVPVGTR